MGNKAKPYVAPAIKKLWANFKRGSLSANTDPTQAHELRKVFYAGIYAFQCVEAEMATDENFTEEMGAEAWSKARQEVMTFMHNEVTNQKGKER